MAMGAKAAAISPDTGPMEVRKPRTKRGICTPSSSPIPAKASLASLAEWLARSTCGVRLLTFGPALWTLTPAVSSSFIAPAVKYSPEDMRFADDSTTVAVCWNFELTASSP